MSQIRTAKAGDVGAFPGSTFVVDGSPPITQCQETQIDAGGATIVNGSPIVTKAGAFVGIDLTGKTIIIIGTFSDDGTYNILSNTDDTLTTDHTFAVTEAIPIATIQDPGEVYLTRNESSFTRFIQNQGKAHTTKGGQLFTDIADPPMDAACSDTWNPQ